MTRPEISARGWNRALLGRQMLLARHDLDVPAAVGRLMAVQSQYAPSAYLALWNRLAGFEPAALDAAYASGAVVKASLMRITLQTVRADDLPAFAAAMSATLSSRLADSRFADGGIARDAALAAAPELLDELREPRTNAQMEAWTQQRFGEHPTPSVWWALRYLLPVVHAPTGGPWAFGQQPAYVASGAPPHHDLDDEARTEATAVLVRRYLAAFGPATVADIARFSTLLRAPIRPALARIGDEIVETSGPPGAMVDLADPDVALLPDPETPAPARLLGMWDDALLGSADRSRTVPPELRKAVVRQNGDVLPTLLVDGCVAGTWRVAHADGRHRIEAHALRPIAEADWSDLEAEATALLQLLADRDPAPFARYDHWWGKHMPSLETRLLG